MTNPVWNTPEGSIGNFVNGSAVSVAVSASAVAPATSVRYTLSRGTLPTYLTLNSGNGAITGIPSLVSQNVTNTFTVQATDNLGNKSYRVFAITILSTQPVWVTDVGSLGTIPESVYFQTPLIAYDPSNPDNKIYYELLAGQLPPGIQLSNSTASNSTVLIDGVPLLVSKDTISTFAIRAYTKKIVQGKVVIDRLADRTFSLTVTGQNTPQFVTPSGNVGTFYDGTPIDPIQIVTATPDPGTTTVITVANGVLPPGLSISAAGLITGYVIPVTLITEPGGFDRYQQNFDMNPFDFVRASPNTNYQFTLQVSDGRSSNLRTYEIYVYSRSTLQASTTDITSDDTFVDASQTPTYLPFLVNAEPSDLGRVRSGNFWAYQFQGLTFSDYVIEYLEYTGVGLQLPPGTTLDPYTGWLYGYLPDLGATEITYNFAIYLIDTSDPDIQSDPYYFTITLVGQVETQVIWLSDADLGDIINGSTSLLRVQAVNPGGRVLQYRLRPGAIPPVNYVPGVYNKLPQGLQLLPEGDIAGRVSFNTFALDLGTTTFDKKLRAGQINSPQETTFDTQYTFTANAYSSDGLISVFKTFTVRVLRVYNEPYENLYIKAMPPYSNRTLINSLLQNSSIFDPELVFRPQDPNFGIAKSVIYNHCFGLTSATYETYVNSLSENHYWKNLVLGEIKTAQAIDPKTGTVIYEVVYSAIQDNLVNNYGISVSKQVALPYPINNGDSTEISTVYPNSLDNMRNQVIDVVGQISNILPLWMLSKQSDGKVLGFTPAWVIAYCNPGTSGQIAYNIRSQFGQKLNLIDFEVDRYELDRLLSIHWDPVTLSMTLDPEYTGDDLILSNRDLTATATPAVIFPENEPSSLATYSISPGQRVMFSVTIDVWAPLDDYTGVGIANHQFDTNTWLGVDLNSIGFWDDGYVYINEDYTGGYPLFNYDGAIVDVAVDRVSNLIWIRVDGGDWNNNPLASPTLASGGVDISYITGMVYPGVTPYYYSETAGKTSINTSSKYSVPLEFTFIGAEQGSWIPTPPETCTFDVSSGDPTTFDANSMRFEAPVDIYTNTDAFDKYLVFPRRNILV